MNWPIQASTKIATEMIHSGEYVVPTILGEHYLKKPPLQNWLLVLLAAGDPQRQDSRMCMCKIGPDIGDRAGNGDPWLLRQLAYLGRGTHADDEKVGIGHLPADDWPGLLGEPTDGIEPRRSGAEPSAPVGEDRDAAGRGDGFVTEDLEGRDGFENARIGEQISR